MDADDRLVTTIMMSALGEIDEDEARAWHLNIEAMRLAFRECGRWSTLSKDKIEYFRQRAEKNLEQIFDKET